MRACGYAGTGGLGAREDGRERAIEVRVKMDRAGLGHARADGYGVVGDGKSTNARANVSMERVDDVRDGPSASGGGERVAAAAARAREDARARALHRAFRRAFAEPDAREVEGNPVERALMRGRMSSGNPLRRLGAG